jgi:hypothetical protein
MYLVVMVYGEFVCVLAQFVSDAHDTIGTVSSVTDEPVENGFE